MMNKKRLQEEEEEEGEGCSLTLIKGGRIVTSSFDFVGDILIEDGIIVGIFRSYDEDKRSNLKVFDANGLLVFPGGIDPHVHLELPFMGTFSSDDFDTGTAAALHGGTTSIIDFAIQTQGKSLQAAKDDWDKRSVGKVHCDYGYHMAVTDFNEETKKEIPKIISYGITSFKIFMAYKGALMIDDRMITNLMNEVKREGGIIASHCTNGDMIDSLVANALNNGQTAPKYHALTQPDITEIEATGRFADHAFLTKCPAYVVHCTAQGSLNRVQQCLTRNQKIYAETCPQYILLDDSVYGGEDSFEGAKYVISPPIRKKHDQEALWAGIKNGCIDCVATDHCPFTLAQKEMGRGNFSKIPNGLPAIEHRVELMFSEGVAKGKISLQRFVDVTSTNAAKIFGLFPKKGTIAIGSDADLILFDPNAKHKLSYSTHHMRCDYSAFEGWEVTGKIQKVILRGKIVVDDGKLLAPKGYGQFLARKKFQAY